jgi:hypothetical protein
VGRRLVAVATRALEVRDVARRRARLPPAPGAADDLRRALRGVAPIAVPVAALVVWALSLRRINPDAIGATGLVSVLPVTALVPIGAVTVSFCVTLTRPQVSGRVLALHVLALVVMLYSVTAIVEPEPAFEPAYRHVGIADFIARTGGLDTTIDAYFNWPGFFIVAAFLSRVAGLPDALSLVRWAPLAFNLLYLAPLLLIMNALTANRRVVFLALWLFYATNWTAQDYFSPQATAYLLFLVVLGILLRWFTPPGCPATPRQRAGLLGIAIAACAAIVAMHQLTPFALLAAVITLVLFAGATPRLLPVLIAALIGGWVAFMAIGFMAGNLPGLLGAVGDIGGSLSSGLTARVGGDPGHRLVVGARLGLTAAVWALAAFGWWTLRRRGHALRPAAALVLAPIPLLALQPYGGEILIRVALFALPFAAFFAASGLVALTRTRSVAGTAALSIVMAGLLGAFLFARYGNDRMDAFSGGDVAAIRALYRIAPRGSELVAASQPLPWQYRDYDSYTYARLTDLVPGPASPPGRPHRPLSYRVRGALDSSVPGRGYVIVTRSQIAGDDLLGTSGTPARVVAQRLGVSRLFRVAYANPDATIFVLRSRPGAPR